MKRIQFNSILILLGAALYSTFHITSAHAFSEYGIKKTPSVRQSTSSVSYTELKPFSANFVAYRSGNDVGNAVIELKTLSKKRYELTYESSVSRFFLSDRRYEKTIFINQDDNLIPLNYVYKRTGTGPDKALSIKFDQSNKKINIDNTKEFEWKGEFDNQLFRIDFPKKLASGITSTQYNFINYRGEARQYSLAVLETDTLVLPYGNISAVKVLIGRESSSRETYAWFAPSLNFNLVRLQQFKDDKEQADIQLKTFVYL